MNENLTNFFEAVQRIWRRFVNGVRSLFVSAFEGTLRLTESRKCPYCLSDIINRSSRLDGEGKVITCQNCNHDLPSDFFKHKGGVVALVGGPDTGKTTFITVLLRLLQTNTAISRMLKLHSNIIDRDVRRGYINRVNRLFDRLEILPTTEVNSEEARFPIVVKLKHNQGDRSRVMYLSLFDTPGEEFFEIDKLTQVHPHINNADAIIFLIDPMNIRPIYEEVLKAGSQDEFANIREYELEDEFVEYEIMENLSEEFRRKGKATSGGKISIPVAFCLSKADLLSSFTSVYIPDEIDNAMLDKKGVFDEIRLTSEDVSTLLEEKHPSLLNNIEGLFQKYNFFPVAPIGKNPSSEVIDGAPEPKGVLYPLVWILDQLKFI